MYVVIWEYQVAPAHAARFQALYGAQGEWAALFRAWPGFVSTELLCGAHERYVTIDRWHSRDAYDHFRQQAGAQYARLDALGDTLTLDERQIGAFTSAPP